MVHVPDDADASLLLYLYQSPLRIVITNQAGDVELMTPVAAQLLMPLTTNARLDNLWDVLRPHLPQLPDLLAQTDSDTLCDELQFNVPWGRETRTMSLNLHRIGVDKMMASVADVTEQVRRQQQELSAVGQVLADHALMLRRTHKDMRDVLDGLPSLVSCWDRTLRNRFANKSFVDGCGLTPEALHGRKMDEVLDAERLNREAAYVQAVLRGEQQTFERMVEGDGAEDRRFFLVHLLPDMDEGEVRGFYEMAHDISSPRKLQLALTAREALLNTAGRLANVGGWAIDLRTGSVYWSRQIYALADLPDDYTPSLNSMAELLAPADRPVLELALQRAVTHGDSWDLELPMTTANGRYIWAHVIGEVEFENQHPVRIVGAVQDITARREAEQRIEILANQDEVTGLANRSLLLKSIETAIHTGGTAGRRLALLSVQVEPIRHLTQVMGFGAGDALAMAVANRLSALTAPGDTLARLSNEEFAILLGPDSLVGDTSSFDRAQAVLTELARPERIGAVEVVPVARVGVATYPSDADGGGALLQAAQTARTEMTSDARPVARFTDQTRACALRRLAIESGLRRAVERGEVSLQYQFQADLHTGEPVAAEVLLRWHSRELGEVDPADFLPIAQHTGLVVMLGEWQRRTAFAQWHQSHQAGMQPLRVSLNLSALELQQPDIVDNILSDLKAHQLEPSQLALEVSEQALVTGSSEMVQRLAQLRALGTEILLDDFGSGYSNLSLLRRLPVDVVKVHRSCVPDVTAATGDVSLTRAIINMAHSLQIKVLAECVETPGQLTLLIANGCDRMQGPMFGANVDGTTLGPTRNQLRLPEHFVKRQRARTLLLVDDEPNIVSALMRLFRREGYRVVTASSGAEGLQRMAEYEVDVVISDQRMPGMTGVEFLRRAKELYPDTVRMVLSGYTELQSITDAVNEGAIYRFLTKPWDDGLLLVHVREAFRHKGMADENKRLSHEVVSANEALAKVNERLGVVLNSQQSQIDRERTRADVARDIVDLLPVPALGIDPQGTVVLLNAEAQSVLGPNTQWLGETVHRVLKVDMADLTARVDAGAAPFNLTVAGRPFQLRARFMGNDAARGVLVVLQDRSPSQASA